MSMRHCDAIRKSPARRARHRLWCERLEDRTVPSTFTVLNTNDAGSGSLRQAILNANANTGADTIAFAIPGNGVHTIQPLSALPALTDIAGVFIDGYSQSGAGVNTLTVGSDAVLKIELDGSLAGSGVSGLSLTSGNNSVKGLVINRFSGDGITLASPAGGDIIQGNYINMTPDGTASLAQESHGYDIRAGADHGPPILIGGPGAGNVLASGMLIGPNQTCPFIIQGNVIGLNAEANQAVSRVGSSLRLGSVSNSLVGGTSPGAGNLIGNCMDGIALSDGSSGNVIQGNYIGTNPNGEDFGNKNAGITIYAGSFNNSIGGTNPGEGNTIAFNGFGVTLGQEAGIGNSIRGNSIYNNQGALHHDSALGIAIYTDQFGYGGTPNDSTDSDGGGNNLQNHPTLTQVVAGAPTRIFGSLQSTPNTTFWLDFYANVSPHYAGYGEGERYLGSAQVTTDGSGNVTFDSDTFPVPLGASAADEWFSATATDAAGNTSEFSPLRLANVPAASLTVTTVNDTGPGSLRYALIYAEVHPGPDTITFNIPGTGMHTIAPSKLLPSITEAVTIDGYSQPGASANTQAVGSDAVLRIALDGGSLPASACLTILGSGSAVRGLRFQHFDNAAAITDGSAAAVRILGAGATGNAIAGNFIGTDGTQALNDGGYGIQINAASDNIVGGTNPADRNVIVGNGGTGIELNGPLSGNVVEGNYVGLNAAGTAELGGSGHGHAGIRVRSLHGAAVGNRIGGPTPASRNVISGWTINVVLAGGYGIPSIAVIDTRIEGNYIGTNATGDAATGNFDPNNPESGSYGVFLAGTWRTGNLVIDNLISGNAAVGIVTLDAGPSAVDTIQGNRIGTDASGQYPIANSGGVSVADESTTLIGGTGPGQGNLIAFTNSAGIVVAGSGKTIAGNSIHDNAGSGIDIGGSGIEVTANVVTDNSGAGVTVFSGVSNVLIEDNTVTGNGYDAAFSGWGHIDGNGPGIWVMGNAFDYNNSGISIRRNAVSANAGPGINVGDIPMQGDGVTPALIVDEWAWSIPDGVTANDMGDGDDGSNGGQNFPVIATGRAGSKTFVSGTLNSTANATFTLDFFASSAADPSGHGEGDRWLGSVDVTTDGNGDATFAATLDAASSLSEWITATATNDDGSTSEFSAAFEVMDLAVYGTAGNDTLTVTPAGGGQVQITVNGTSQTYTLPGGIYLLGGGGADGYAITFGADVPNNIVVFDDGATGTDDLTFHGTTLADTFTKSGGTVQWQPAPAAPYKQVDFDGIDGLVTLDAGAGNDTIIDPNSGNFLILGGDGNDTIVIADTTGLVTADGGAGSDTYVVEAANLQGPVNITDTGTTGTDGVTVAGTPAADSISQSGNQVVANGGTITLGGVDALAVDGGGGTDDFTVVTPPTVPTTVTGVADTVIDGTAGSDTIRLTAGTGAGEVKVRVNGVVVGTYRPTGRMIVHGGDGNDDIDVATAVATPVWVYGGAGDDEVHAGGGSDHLFGEAGNDRLFARVGDDELDGGDGNDELRAGSGSDVARGGAGCDELWGGTGNDQLYGDGGNDVLRGGGGCDRLDGGDGDDELRAGAGGDTLLGGGGNDTMKGGQGSDWMDGGTGNDRLDGMAGNDVLLGGDGDDLLMGGADRDLMIGGRGADRVEGNSDEDILIAGYTLFDGNAAALGAILAEWTSGNSYATRVANITGGTGLTQGFRLWADAGAAQSVFDDDAYDVLAGGAGIDWFFANVNGTGVLDAISDLRANELWTDTDF